MERRQPAPDSGQAPGAPGMRTALRLPDFEKVDMRIGVRVT
jgi:hypothetical protein